MKVLLILFCLLAYAITVPATHCKCVELLSQSDCAASPDYVCSWDAGTNICGINSNAPLPSVTYQTYCNQLSQGVCSSTIGCGWTNETCDSFSGCTAYVFKTREECKLVQNQCTSNGVHCVDITTCPNYKTETSCYQNQQGNYCFWNATQCIDPIECTQLPSVFDTDAKCREQLSKCTVGQNGGCTESGNTCGDQKYEKACFWDKLQQQLCYWNSGTCTNRICSNAPVAYVTDQACQSYLVSCTVKLNGGCTNKTTCSGATIKEACVTNSNGEHCYWADSVCIDKQCTKAPSSYTTDKQCKQISPNCISTTSGCIVQVSCSSATSEVGCVDMPDGTKCYWTGTQCRTKTCSNAYNLSTQEQCQAYIPSCTVNSAGDSCVVRTCETAITQSACITDANNNKCVWKNKCYEKRCTFAPKSLTTFSDCNAYLPTCVLDNSGNGCMNMALSCAAYISQFSCTMIQNNKYCGWNGTKCVDRECSMAAQTLKTTADCQSYKPDCLLSNDTQGGCMNITSNCSDRKLQGNCQFGITPICIWNTTACVQQSCETANIVGSPSALNSFNTTTCSGYLSGCILNNSGDGCISKPITCSLLGVLNCNVAKSGDCFWSGGECKDKVCTNINESTHINCNTQFNKCTVNSTGTGCMNIATRCSIYSIASQCYVSATNTCFWTGTICRDAECPDALDSSAFDTYEECTALNAKCTVVSIVNKSGCVSRLSNCEDYKYQYQCVKTINFDNCIWQNNQCYQLSVFTCGIIVVSPYNDANCGNVMAKCKANLTSTGCISKVCSDYALTTKVACEAISGCTINKAATACTIKKDQCISYTVLSDCKYAREGECVDIGTKCIYKYATCSAVLSPADDAACALYRAFCTFTTSGTTTITTLCTNRTCESFSGVVNYDNCQSYDISCVNSSSGQCITIPTTCVGTSQINCQYSVNEKNCIWNSNLTVDKACVPVGVASQQNCYLITGTGFTLDYCSSTMSPYCSVNRSGTACVNLKSQCSSYSPLESCVFSSSGICIQNQSADAGATCTNILSTTPCNQLYRGSTFVYTHAECFNMKNTCTNNGTTGCQDKTCANATGLTTHADCQSWLSTCTINGGNTQCVQKTTTCLEQTISSCLWSMEGNCAVIDGKCRKMICENAPSTFTSDSQCNNYLTTCTVARIGGCITKLDNCSNYLTALQCKYNNNNTQCWWNQSDQKCVDLKCELIEQSASFDAHDECYNVSPDLKCTVGDTAVGCRQLGLCSDYTLQQQCVIDKSSKDCIWSDNTCQYKTCNIAPLSNVTHQQCQAYHATCTVKDSDPPQGCQTLSSCTQYMFETQCYINDTGLECGWVNGQCLNKGCLTSPVVNDTHEKCVAYLPNCTGCVDIPATCEDLASENQCVVNKNGQSCSWQGSKCITKSCDNTPDDVDTAAECSAWLPKCIADDAQKCKQLTCDEYAYTTDSECKAVMSSCTTDGTKCVMKGTCMQALSIQGCNTSTTNDKCYWTGQYCTVKICSVITTQQDCNIASDGTKCIWDATKCRNIGECSDYSGTTHQQCQQFSNQCTIGKDEMCAKIANCSDITNRSACINGFDGPCLWVVSFNKCYQYTSCASIKKTTDYDCKQVSAMCTTDGTQCVAISSCSETNTKGGCVTGIDGECMQTIPELKSNAAPICKLYTSCTDAFYLTHKDCQTANKKCTTNGITSCVSLSNCTSYSRVESCVIDDQGVQLQNSLIVSTGQCVWDEPNCRNQNCQDLTGITNEQCKAQLSSCTFDGSKCIEKQSCNEYTSTLCEIAEGTEGKCNWMVTFNSCQVLTCSGIDGGNTIAACQSKLPNCISDGTGCIDKDMCQRYLTKIACNSGGLDGICVWNLTSKSCSLMNSCTQADQDQEACISAKDRCQFKYATTSASSSCSTHTCETFQKSNGLCKAFFNWDKSSKTVCSMIDTKCSTTDPVTFDQAKCFTLSEYTYSWNSNKSKCQSCVISSSNSNSSSNTTKSDATNSNTTPTTSVEYSQYLSMTIILIFI